MSEKFWIVLPKTFEVVTLLDNGMRHIRNDIPSSLIRYNTRPDAIAAAKKEVKVTRRPVILMEAIAIIEPEEKPVKVRDL